MNSRFGQYSSLMHQDGVGFFTPYVNLSNHRFFWFLHFHSMEIDPSAADFNDVRSELTCPICHGIIVEPVELPCGHPTCSLCMRKWLSNHSSCPLCNSPSQEQPQPVSRVLQRILERVTTVCENTGCFTILTPATVVHHKRNCIYRMEVCDNPDCMKPVQLCRMASHRMRCTKATDVVSPYELMCVDCKLLQRLNHVVQHCATVYED